MLKKEITEENKMMRKRQEQFRRAAEYVAADFSEITEVQKVILFGSVVWPLKVEVPRFRKFQRAGIAILHECKDVDLAVWITELSCLKKLQKARAKALNRLLAETGIGVAHHQCDVFIMEPVTNRYLGRLCWFGTCPKGKNDCYTAGCGQIPFLHQHKGFDFDFKSLGDGSGVTLFECRKPQHSASFDTE